MKTEVRVSYAIVTRSVPKSLELGQASLRRGHVQPCEIVVSDDCDEQHTAATLEVAERFETRYVPAPSLGFYANSNHAALDATETHVRKVDDDRGFPPGHVEVVNEAVASDPAAVWTGSEFSPGDSACRKLPRFPVTFHPRGFSSIPRLEQCKFNIADGFTGYSLA